MANIVEGTSGSADHYPDLRGSAATVLAVPQPDVATPDVAMSAAAKSEAATAEDAASKRQKKDKVTLDTIDLDSLPDGFKATIVTADDGLVLTQGVRSLEALAVKHHQAAVLYRDTLRGQAVAHGDGAASRREAACC